MAEKLLGWLIKLWVTLFVLLTVLAIIGSFMNPEYSVLDFIEPRKRYSPFNYRTFIFGLAILYPAIVSYAVREKLRGTLESHLMGPSWYFKRGLWSLFTIPLFLFLSWLLVFDIISTIIQNLGLVRALSAVYGLPGRIAFFLFGWIPAMLPT